MLALGGAGNVLGLLLTYTALRVGKVGGLARPARRRRRHRGAAGRDVAVAPDAPRGPAGRYVGRLGFALFALGARHGIAVSSVLVSEFGAIAAVASFFLFRERLARVQPVRVTAILLGVGMPSALQA